MKRFAKHLMPLLAAALLLLTACTPSPGTSNEKESLLDPENPITITVWHYYNSDQLTAFDSLVEEFNNTRGKELGIYVDSYNHGSVNDLETNVLAAAQGKVGADKIPSIFAAYADTAYAIDQMGLAVDLTEYLTEEEIAAFIPSYMEEGRFSKDGGLKIFPVAKSTEVFLLNKTDWDAFAQATGATYDDFSTIEGLTATAQAYYEWTDGLTPDVPNDGRAFFGRDAMANYFLVGAMQLGTELFAVEDGKMTLNFDHDTVQKLWDNYYIPYVKGYFAASGRFRSDDIKTQNIISYVGSSSSATFFPDAVTINDTTSYPIEMEAFACPQFEGGSAYAVQQGAGMVVTAGDEAQVQASIAFLKWFTQDAQNISYSVGSGYLPVTRSANQVDAILAQKNDVSDVLERILTVAVGTVNDNTLYTPKAFQNGTSARNILEYSMSDLAKADRATVEERLAAGQSLAEASAEFTSAAYFEAWYQSVLSQLQALADA